MQRPRYFDIMVLACVCACVEGASDKCAGAASDEPYRFFSTRTSYDVARGRKLKIEHVPGCEAKQLYMLIRHGTRYPGQDEIEAMRDYLPPLREALLRQSHNSSLCPETFQKLEQWQLKFRVEDALEITDRGLEEMYHIGRRMRVRFPSVYAKVQEDINGLDLRYSENYRNALSAKYFAMGFMDQDISQPGQFRDDVGYSVAHTEDRLLLYCDLCHRYIAQRLQERGPEKSQTIQFNEGSALQQVLAELTRDFPLSENQSWDLVLLNTVMEACRFGYAVHGESAWCEVLPLRAIKALEYRQDMKYYWRYGHGRDVNYKPACVLLQDVLDNLKGAAKNGSYAQPAVLRFGHSRTILPFLVRLGLFNESISLLAENYESHLERRWQLGKINPFSSNLAFVLYDCQSNEEEPLVQTFLNERQIQLPGCSEQFCRLSELEKAWSHVISSCDFEDICDLGEGYDGLRLEDIHKDLHHA